MAKKWQQLPPRTALLKVVTNTDTDIETVRQFLAKLKQDGFDVNKIKDAKDTPLLQMAILAAPESCAVLHLLVEFGANPMLQNKEGRTSLHAASCMNNLEMLAALLPERNVNMQDKAGNTLLHLAVTNRCVEVAEWLLFAGANPDIMNKDNKTARHCTPDKCFQLKTILRNPRVNEPKPYVLNTETMKTCTSKDDRFSIEVMTSSDGSSRAAIMVQETENSNLHQHFRSHDGETFWGNGLEYLGSSQLNLTLTFTLHDKPDAYHELVLRVHEERDDEVDVPVEIQDIVENEVEEEADLNQWTVETAGPEPKCVAKARTRVDIAKTGHLGLVYRPRKDTLIVGKNGGHVTSSVDERVRVEAHVTEGPALAEDLMLHFQVKPTPPLQVVPNTNPETAAEGRADDNTQVLRATLPYSFKLTSQRSLDKETSDRIVSEASLPISEQFDKARDAYVYRRTSEEGETSKSDIEELEIETKKWTSQPQVISLERLSSSVSVPASLNQTTTVVQSTAGATEEEVRRAVAREHIKSQQIRVRFHVFVNISSGLIDETRHTVVVIQVKAVGHEKTCLEGYQKVKVTDVLYVPCNTLLQISASEDCDAEFLSQSTAHIRFQHGIQSTKMKPNCIFMVKRDKNTVSKLNFRVEKGRKAADTKDGGVLWKPLTDFEFELPPEGKSEATQATEYGEEDVHLHERSESSKGATQDSKQTTSDPFTDQFLLEFARQIPPGELFKLGIELLCENNRVENVLRVYEREDMEVKAFQILKKAREYSHTAHAFATRLTSALQRVQLIKVLEWLKDQLSSWDVSANYVHTSASPFRI